MHGVSKKSNNWLHDELHTLVGNLLYHSRELSTSELPADYADDSHIIEEAASKLRSLLTGHLATHAPAAELRELAHDLRNPLSVIIGFSQLIVEDTGIESARELMWAANYTMYAIDSIVLHQRGEEGVVVIPRHASQFDVPHEIDRLYLRNEDSVNVDMGIPVLPADAEQCRYMLGTAAFAAMKLSTAPLSLRASRISPQTVQIAFYYVPDVPLPMLTEPLEEEWIPLPTAPGWQYMMAGAALMARGHGGEVALTSGNVAVAMYIRLPLPPLDA